MHYVQAKGGLLVPDRRLRVPQSPTRQRGFLGWGPAFLRKPSSGGDPYWANVVSLLHCDGANGSTSFTDQVGNAWTRTGSAAISTTQSQFGGASLHIPGSGSYLSASASALNLSASDYFIEGWAYIDLASISVLNAVWTNYVGDTTGRLVIAVNTSGKLAMVEQDAGGANNVSCTAISSFPLRQWVSFAAGKRSNTLYLFQNGHLEASAASSARTFAGSATVGKFSTGSFEWPLAGYVDEIRVTKGVCRAVTDYSVATAAFPDHA